MFYVKNVPGWERLVRVLSGLALAAVALTLAGGALGWLLGAAALGALASGLFGFCPACALLGRKLR